MLLFESKLSYIYSVMHAGVTNAEWALWFCQTPLALLADMLICVIRTLHDCPSQMNENLLISNSKLTSDSELIWWR